MRMSTQRTNESRISTNSSFATARSSDSASTNRYSVDSMRTNDDVSLSSMAGIVDQEPPRSSFSSPLSTTSSTTLQTGISSTPTSTNSSKFATSNTRDEPSSRFTIPPSYQTSIATQSSPSSQQLPRAAQDHRIVHHIYHPPQRKRTANDWANIVLIGGLVAAGIGAAFFIYKKWRASSDTGDAVDTARIGTLAPSIAVSQRGMENVLPVVKSISRQEWQADVTAASTHHAPPEPPSAPDTVPPTNNNDAPNDPDNAPVNPPARGSFHTIPIDIANTSQFLGGVSPLSDPRNAQAVIALAHYQNDKLTLNDGDGSDFVYDPNTQQQQQRVFNRKTFTDDGSPITTSPLVDPATGLLYDPYIPKLVIGTCLRDLTLLPAPSDAPCAQKVKGFHRYSPNPIFIPPKKEDPTTTPPPPKENPPGNNNPPQQPVIMPPGSDGALMLAQLAELDKQQRIRWAVGGLQYCNDANAIFVPYARKPGDTKAARGQCFAQCKEGEDFLPWVAPAGDEALSTTFQFVCRQRCPPRADGTIVQSKTGFCERKMVNPEWLVGSDWRREIGGDALVDFLNGNARQAAEMNLFAPFEKYARAGLKTKADVAYCGHIADRDSSRDVLGIRHYGRYCMNVTNDFIKMPMWCPASYTRTLEGLSCAKCPPGMKLRGNEVGGYLCMEDCPVGSTDAGTGNTFRCYLKAKLAVPSLSAKVQVLSDTDKMGVDMDQSFQKTLDAAEAAKKKGGGGDKK